MTTKALHHAALAATAAVLLLAGCTATAAPEPAPLPVEPDGGIGVTDPTTLSYPYLVDPVEAVKRWRALGEDFTAQLAAFDASCSPADVLDDDACDEALDDFIVSVNGIYQEWWGMDNANWESGDYSGLVALKPTRDATLAARASFDAWSCLDDDVCVETAEAFHADLTELDAAFTAWRG